MMDFMDLIEIAKVSNVKLTKTVFDDESRQFQSKEFDGLLNLTCHHLIFTALNEPSESKHRELWVSSFNKHSILFEVFIHFHLSLNLKILHSLVDQVERRIVNNVKYQLVLKCKNFRTFQLDFANLNVCQSVAKSLESLSNLSMS